jgi:hypothetical protein
MYRNQVLLGEGDLEQNKIFLRNLYLCDKLEDSNRYFDKLDGSTQRETDEGMTLDKFLGLMDDTYHINLQIGSPAEGIRYCASGYNLDFDSITRFAWVICPLNDHNFKEISDMFENVYGKRIESIEVPEYLKKYHEEMGLR